MALSLQQSVTKIDRWSVIKLLGTGRYSNVYLGYDEESGTYAAIKISRHFWDVHSFQSEALRHSNFYHEHIIELKSYHQAIVLYDTDRNWTAPGIVMEYAKGDDLLSLVKTLGSLPEKIGRTYLKQIISVLEYMHRKGYSHQDIKLENILLDEDYCVKISDFGCTRKFESSKQIKGPMGTSSYFTPEINEKKPFYQNQADLFAAAIVTFTMVIGHKPFEKATRDNQFYSLIYERDIQEFWRAHGMASMRIPGNRDIDRVSGYFKNLMVSMFAYDPRKRPTLEQVKRDDWLKGETLTREQMKQEITKLLMLQSFDLEIKEECPSFIMHEIETAPVTSMISE